jgi:hypothetical protein
MQVVVTELCASLIFPWADALAADPAIANMASRMVQPRMIASLCRKRLPTIDDVGAAVQDPPVGRCCNRSGSLVMLSVDPTVDDDGGMSDDHGATTSPNAASPNHSTRAD